VLAENSGRWESLGDRDRERLALVASAIVKRLLSDPTLRLKARGDEQQTYVYVQALRELFGLDEEAESAFERRVDERPREKDARVTPLRQSRGRKRGRS